MTKNPRDNAEDGGGEPEDSLGGLLRELDDREHLHGGTAETQPISRKEARHQAEARERSSGRGKRGPRRHRGLGIFLIIVVVIAGLGGGVFALIQGPLQGPFNSLLALGESDNYEGDGTGQVTVVINDGDIGIDIAHTLADAGVVKSSSSFYKYLLALSKQPTFQPGSYNLRNQMSNTAALSALLDDNNRVARVITVPEGFTVDQIFARLETIGFAESELTTLRKDPQQFGVPSGAIDLEGFLFPATYTFDASTTAKQALQTMVTRTFTSLDKLGVAETDRTRVVILASLIQKEAGASTSDMSKVSRVFLNRISDGMLLQSDATVAYGAGSQGTVWTTSAQRADASNIFNTYVHAGLPPGAISNPGDDALTAAVQPAAGSWLFFTVVNLQTGETVFSDDAAGHAAAVQQLQDWCKASDANAAYCS